MAIVKFDKWQGKNSKPLGFVSAYRGIAAFNRANNTDVRFLTAKAAKTLIERKDPLVSLCNDIPLNAVVAYEKPDKELGSEIIFAVPGNIAHQFCCDRVIFPTGDFKGERNLALSVQGLTFDDFTFDGRDVVIHPAKIHATQFDARGHFSTLDSGNMMGCALVNEKTQLPETNVPSSDPNSRYFERMTEPYVGPIYYRPSKLGYSLVLAGGLVPTRCLVKVPKKDLAKLSHGALLPEASISMELNLAREDLYESVRALEAVVSDPANLEFAEARQQLGQLLSALTTAKIREK